MTAPDKIERRDAAAREADTATGGDLTGADSAAVLMRYAARLTLAQAPMRALAAMTVKGNA